MVKKKLQAELLLELILNYGGEINEQEILKKSIPLYLRKLNCLLAGILKKKRKRYSEQFLSPIVAGNSSEWGEARKHFEKNENGEFNPCKQFFLSGIYYFAYRLNDYGILILGRKKPFDLSFCHELSLVINHLGKTLIQAQEIEKRKKAEKKLKIREDRLSKIMLAANDGMWDWDLITNEVYFDPRYYEMAGYKTNEFPHKLEEFSSRIHPDDHDQVMLYAQKHLSGEYERFGIEFRYRKKDNSWLWVMGKGIIVERNKKGVPLRFVGTHTDITDRKNAEDSLRESEAKFRGLVESSSDWIWEVDKNGKYTYASPQVENILGYKPEEIIGKFPMDLMTEKDAEKAKEKLTTNGQNGTSIITFENTNIHKNGQEVVLETSGVPAFDKNGELSGYRGIDRDITERKIAQEAINESEEKYRNVVERASDGIAIVQDNVVKFCNSHLAKLWGGKVEEMLNTNFTNYVHPDDLLKLVTLYKERIDGKNAPSIYETVFIKKNGQNLYAELNAGIISFNSKPADLVIIRDITERKQTELKLLAAKEKAEESDRLKSAFLANMSHEIRTPMNAILGFTSLLKEPKLSGKEKQEFINIIELSGKRMLTTIDDLVDISKIESGQEELYISDININEQLEYIYSLFKPEAEEKNLELILDLHSEAETLIIKTDGDKLNATLSNLVKNAIKYTDKGSIEVGFRVNDNQLEFIIKDTGIGIPKDKKDIIFQRFVQGDIGNKRAYQGAGLGLSIAKSYVEMLGGNLWVESLERKGSQFHFTIPLEVNEQPFEKRVVGRLKTKTNKLADLKIVIAEDDEPSQFFLTEIVSKISSKIIHVMNGQAAVDACKQNSDIDILLIDIKMPEMDGYEATRLIRKFNKEVIIIAQTAYGLIGDRDKALNAGCNDYIAKPIDKEKLIAMMNKYLK